MNTTIKTNQEKYNQKYKGSLVTVNADEGKFEGLFEFIDNSGIMIENRLPNGKKRLLFFKWNQVTSVQNGTHQIK